MRSPRHRVRMRLRPRSQTCSRPVLAALESRTLLSTDVLTYHNDLARTGLNPNESTLTPANVNQTDFGQLASYPADGYVYAQPLYKANVSIGGTIHNVVYVATEHDSVYAFDANNPKAGPGGNGVLWHDSFINPANGITTVPAPSDVDTTDIVPEIGITGTPVIDPTSGTLYVVAKTKEIVSNTAHYVQRLYALDITSGAIKHQVTIGDTVLNSDGSYTNTTNIVVPGTGDGSSGGLVPFNALRENQRAGLALSSGTVYIDWSSHGDNGPYHGWVVGYNAATLQQLAVFNDTPNGGLGGIWEGADAPAIDSSGNLYVSSGNGTFDGNSFGPTSLGGGGGDLGYAGIPDSVAIKIDLFDNSGEGDDSTGLYTDGASPTVPAIDMSGSGINLQGSDPLKVTLSYDGATLTETVVDTVTNATFTHGYAINIPTVVGGSTAFVGFTGGSGGLTAVQDVPSWTYSTGGSTVINHSAGFAANSDLTANGNASFAGSVARITDGGSGEAGSIFSNVKVNVASFTTTFMLHQYPGTNPMADGMTFTIQNNPGQHDFADSEMRLTPGSGGNGLTLTSSFTPANQNDLTNADLDYGSGGTVILPDSVGSATHPHLLVSSDKEGKIFLIDRDSLGGFTPGGPDQIVQELPGGTITGSWDTPAYFNGRIYYGGQGDAIKAFQIASALIAANPVAQSANTFGYPGSSPSISANGTSNGIVWALDVGAFSSGGPTVLHAYDAGTLTELYNSSTLRDQLPGGAVKFSVPTVADGQVFVGTSNSLTIFGEFPPATSTPAAPKKLTATAVSSSQINLTWINQATNATGIEVERSQGGGAFSVIALLSRKATSFSDTGLAPSTTYNYRIIAVNQLGESSPSNIASARTLVAAPLLRVADVLKSQVDLTWNATAVSTYSLQRSTDGVHFTTIASLPNTVTSFQDTGLSPGTYEYRIQAFDSSNISAFSNTVSALLGPIISHVDHSTGFANHSDLTANGSASFPSGMTVAQLTDGGFTEAGTIFTNSLEGVATFTTTFSFQQSPGTSPMADGLTFIIQSNSPTALGPTGGGLGYGPDTPGGGGGIPNSVAVKFDLFDNDGEGDDSTGLYTNGASPTVPAIDMSGSGINLQSSDPLTVTLSYDGSTLHEVIVDNTTHASFTHDYTGVNIPAIVGSNVAYVGFGGGTGGLTTVQDISAWKYTTQDPASGSGSGSTTTSSAAPAATALGSPAAMSPSSSTSGGTGNAVTTSFIGSSQPLVFAIPNGTDSSTGAVDQVLSTYPTARKKGVRSQALVF